MAKMCVRVNSTYMEFTLTQEVELELRNTFKCQRVVAPYYHYNKHMFERQECDAHSCEFRVRIWGFGI